VERRGKGHFIRWSMVGNFVVAVVILLGLTLLHRSVTHSPRVDFLTWIVVLPAVLLGAYAITNRIWQDLEKTYSEDRLPPWK